MAIYVPNGSVAAALRAGADQTEIVFVGAGGELCTNSVIDAGQWTQPLPISAASLAPPGAPVAISQQFATGIPQTDAFVVDNQGALHVFWVNAPGASWKDLKISPAGTTIAGACIATSPQYAPTPGEPKQTDVFLVDISGALKVFYVDEGYNWAPGETISAPGIAEPGTGLAASPQFAKSGINNTITVFLVDRNGALQAYSVVDAGVWTSQKLSDDGMFVQGTHIAVSRQFGAGDAASGDQTDVFLVDKSGALMVFYTFGDSGWKSEKISVDNVTVPGASISASRQFITGVDQTDLFFVDNTGALVVFYVDGAGVWQLESISPEGVCAPGAGVSASQQVGAGAGTSGNQTDVVLVDKNGVLNIFYVVGSGKWQRFLPEPEAEKPAWGLGSNSNFILFDRCSEISGLSVEIAITEAIVSNNGVGFQLNCYSALGSHDVWQQYVIHSPPSEPLQLVWFINNWNNPNDWTNGITVNDGAHLAALPAAAGFVIPAGYRLTISLTYVSGSAVIDGANFLVHDLSGQLAGSFKYEFLKDIETTGKKVTASDLAPIVGFQLNIVGWNNGASTVLSSGAGSIQYTVTGGATIAPVDGQEQCMNATNLFQTGETANTSYSYLAADGGNVLSQLFQYIS